MSTTSATAHLTSTIESLSQGLSHAKPGATRSLNSWVETLTNANESALHTLANELTHLSELLANDHATPAQLKQALTSIGKHTLAAAKGADGATADKITKIGHLLTEAAGQLG